jgi:hypothetical protein
MRYKPSLAQLRHLTLREQRQRDEWEEAYRSAVKRETLMLYAVRAIASALVGVTILALLLG